MLKIIFRYRKIKSLLIILLLSILPAVIYSQEDSRYDSGMNLPFNRKAGNVNPQTGNVSAQMTDIALPGRAGVNFTFSRMWSLNKSNAFNMYYDADNKQNRLDSNTLDKYYRLGIGWSSNIPFIREDASSGNTIITLFLGGNAYELDQTGLHTKNLNNSNILGYDLNDIRVYYDKGISYEEFISPVTEESLDDIKSLTEYNSITDNNGETSKYLLLFKDNSKMWFRGDGQLMMYEDRTGLNKIWYFYEASELNEINRLRLVVDSIGRKIDFSYTANDCISVISYDVSIGVKEGESREYRVVTRQVRYDYYNADDGGAYPLCASVKGQVIDYKSPYLLKDVYDQGGNRTMYSYEEGEADFTFNNSTGILNNVYLMLNKETVYYDEVSGKCKYNRCFEYEVPVDGMYRRYFYKGFMEYYKVSRQYYINRHGEILNDTYYD